MAPFIINPYYVLASSGDFPPITDSLEFFLNPQVGIFTDAGTTKALDGEKIQQLEDQSDAEILITNTDVTQQIATYSVGTLNGKNSIRVQATGDASETYFMSDTVDLTNLYTLHWVYKKDTLADHSLVLAAGQTELSDSPNGYTYLLGAAYNSYNGGTEWTVASVIQRDGEDGFFDYYINGVKLGTISSSAAATISIDRFFQRPSARTTNFNLGDVIIYSAVQTPRQVKDIQNYINDKYDQIYLATDETLPTPPTVGTTTLDWYYTPDYNTYSDVGQTYASDLDFIRSTKVTTGDYESLHQYTAANQMQYRTNTLPSGKSSYYKNGRNSMIMSNGITFTPSESFVAYSVHKREVISGTNAIFGKNFSTNSVIMDWNSDIVYYRSLANAVTLTGLTNSLSTVVRAYVIDRDADLFRVYENGIELNNISITGITDNTEFDMMFNRYTNATGAIDHGAVLLYRGLHNAADVVTVSDWLNEYYGDNIYDHPPIMSDLELYVNPDMNVFSDTIGTLAEDGDNIRQIDDQSTNRVVLDQATASAQFVFKNNVLGTGNSGLFVQDSTKFMEFNNTITIPGATKSISFYAVYDRINNGAINYIYGSSSGNFDRILQIVGNSNVYFQDSSGVTINTTSTVDLSNIVIKAYVLDTATDTLTTYLNGTLESTVTVAKTWGDFNFSRFWGENGFGGYIGKTLLYSDAHDATQVGQISDWLNDKYNVY